MKAVIVLADGTRYVDQEIDDAALRRGYIEFSRVPSIIQQAEQPEPQPPREYAVCLHNGNENGVPLFRERQRSTPPTPGK